MLTTDTYTHAQKVCRDGGITDEATSSIPSFNLMVDPPQQIKERSFCFEGKAQIVTKSSIRRYVVNPDGTVTFL